MPGHTELVANEKADVAAAIAVSLRHTSQLKLSNTEICEIIKKDLTHYGTNGSSSVTSLLLHSARYVMPP